MMSQFKNENGQATIAALAILPIACAVFIGFLIFAYAFSIEARTAAACRSSMMESQSEAAEALQKLLALNSKAERAEKSYQIAKNGVRIARATGLPPFIAIAETAYAGAYMYQTSIFVRQKFWLMKGRYSSWRAPQKAFSAILEKLPKNRFRSFIEARSAPELRIARFHVIASSEKTRTPTYRTAPDFEKSQIARVQWLHAVVLSNERSEFSIRPKVQIGCAASLKHEGGDTWVPQLIEDKLLSN